MTTETVKKVSISSEKNVTKEEIVEEANGIWKNVLKTWKNIVPVHPPGGKKAGPMQLLNSDIEILDRLFEKVRAEHKEFAQSYPTVLRHMVQDKWYDTDAFTEYMGKVALKPWTNDTERMDSYADYACALFRKTSKHHLNMTHISAFRRDYRERLQKEHDDFLQNYEKFEKEYNLERSAVDLDKRTNLIAAFKRIAPDAGLSAEKIADVESMISRGLIATEQLESLVYDLRRIIAGVSADQIREEYIAHRRRQEEVEANTTVHLTSDMDKESVEKMKQLVSKNVSSQ